MIIQMRQKLRDNDVHGAIQAARKEIENGDWRSVLSELIVAASEEVNWDSFHYPVGLPMMRTIARILEKSKDPWKVLQSAIHFICKLDRIPPGPSSHLAASTREKNWDLTKLTVELLRIVRKSNYYKVYSILATIEKEDYLFKALYAVSSVVPGPRGYNVILVQSLQDLYPYLAAEQKKQVLLSVVEMFTTLVQSSRYTTTLLYLVGLSQLNEYLPKEPAKTYGENLINWMTSASTNEIYWHLQQNVYSDDEILNACFQMLLVAPGLDGVNVLQTFAFKSAFETCRDSFYFNKRNMWSFLIRELTNPKARSVKLIPKESLENAHAFLSLPLEYLLALDDADLMKVAIVVSKESKSLQEELFTRWLEAGAAPEIRGIKLVVLDHYLIAADQSHGKTKAMFIYRALQELKEVHMCLTSTEIFLEPLI